MDSITLSKATIKAVNSYAEDYYPDEEKDAYSLEGVEFKQDGCDIIVDMDIYGHWNNWTEKHDELPPPNEEYFSEWAYVGHDITNIVAYDQEGEEVTITNENEI